MTRLAPADFNGDSKLDFAATANFNGDGKLDLAVRQETIRVALGNGTFGRWTPYTTSGQNPRHVTAGDLNGDQSPNLAVVTRTYGPVFHSFRNFADVA